MILGEYLKPMNKWLSKAASKMDTETQQMSLEGKSIQQELRSYRFHRPMVPKNQRGLFSGLFHSR